MGYKDFLTVLGIAVAASGYLRYIYSIFYGTSRPHFFSYFVWGIAEATNFAVQLLGHAGFGAWITGWNAFACFVIAGLALTKGDRKFNKADWVSLFASILALALWALTKDALIAVILLILSDAIAYSITFRKTYRLPYSEPLSSYFLSWCKSLIALFAFRNYAVANWLFLAYLLIINAIFIITTLIRRRQLKTS